MFLSLYLQHPTKDETLTDEDEEVEATEIVVKCEEKETEKSNHFPLLPSLAPENGRFPIHTHPCGAPPGGHPGPPPPSILNSTEDMPPILRPPLPFLHPAFMSKMNPGLPTSVYETIAASWRR